MEVEKQRPIIEHSESKKSNIETHNGSDTFDHRVEKGLITKLDAVILPLLALSYLVAYMDRNNIGYARLMNFEQDLHLSAEDYYNCVMVFFAGYLVTVFPANILIRKLGPNVQIGGAVTIFGLFVCCMCAARGFGDVVGLRFGIGAAEALLQSSPLYLSIWYSRNELGKRIAFFYSAATISGVFSGFIAYGIQKNLTISGARPAWEWLFLIEGVIAVALGLGIVVILPKFPDKFDKSWLLTRDEVTLANDRSKQSNTAGAALQIWQAKASLLDPKTWLLGILSGVNSMMLACAGAFLPTIVKSFGYTAVQSQLFTVIPYACAFISMIVISILSDRFRNKGYFILGSLSCCVIGLVILLSTTTKEAGMTGASLLVLGAYPAAVMQITWIQITFCGYTKRAVSWGVAMIFGQGLSMAGAQIYTTPPRFFKGHGVLLGLVIVGMICTALVQILMARANKQRDQVLKEYEESGKIHPDTEKTFEETCDNHVNFRYTL